MSLFQLLPSPIKPYSFSRFTAGTALLLTTLFMFALNATAVILFLAAAMVVAWYAGLNSTAKKLEKERDIISKVIGTADCLIVVLDKQGRIVSFNQACEKTTGYSFAEVKDKFVWDLFLIPEEIEPVTRVFSKLKSEQFYSQYENYWQTKNGGKRLISWSNTVSLDRAGLVEYIIATGIDITDRHQAELALALSYRELEDRVKQRTAELSLASAALQAQEERFRCLSSCSPVGIFMADVRGRYTYANPQCQAICGISCGEILGDGWMQTIHPQERSRVLACWSDYTARGGQYAIEYRLQTAEGIVRWVNVASSPMFSDAGELIGYVGTVRDVTDRQQALSALSSSEQQLRTLLENTPDIIIRTDRQLRYVYVNQAVARTQGQPAEYFIGKTSEEIGMPPQLCQMWEESLHKVLETGQEEIIEFEVPSNSGFRTYQSRIVPELDSEGAIQYALIVARDITELKLAEVQKAQLIVEQAAREKAEKEQARSAFLAEVSKMLAAAFDGETVLQKVAELAVPIIADGCYIHLTENDGTVRQVAIAHTEIDRVSAVNQLQVRHPLDERFVNGYPLVIRSGKAELIVEINEEILARAAENEAELEIWRSLDIGSHACVPMTARGRVLGAISCFTSKFGRRYNAEDLAILEDLAYRVAIALDNARLYAAAQQALAQKSESFALIDSLLEASPLGICFLDRQMRFIRINQVLADINGLPAAAHLGQDYRQLLPESAADFAPLIEQVLATGESVLNVEISGEPKGKPGDFRHWIGNYYPVKNEQGEILGAGIILTDITAAKQTEIALIESERRFRSVVESDMIGIGFWDVGGAITEANNALLEMIGYSREDLVAGNLRWSELTPPEYRERDKAALAEVAATGYCRPYEKEYIRKDGSRLPILVGAGNLEGYYDRGSFFVLDITDRKLAQNQIRENEARIARQLAELDLVYNTAPVGLSFLDTDLRYVRMNEYQAAIDGRSIADHVGRTVTEAIPELADLVEPIYRQVLATGAPVIDLELQAETLQRPGVVRDWLLSFYPVWDESGALLGVSTVVAEITPRKQAERALKQSELVFRRLFESNIFGVAIGDFSGRIAYANDALLKMVGYTRADVLCGNLRWDKMTGPEYLHLDARATQELRDNGVATPFKKEYIRKDGSRVPVLMGATTLEAGDREPQTIVGFYIDLTEIERVESELQNHQKRLQIAQQAGRIGTFEWNIQTNQVSWAPELEALYGLPAGGFDGNYETWLAMVHPDDRAFAEEHARSRAASGGELDMEFRICRPDRRNEVRGLPFEGEELKNFSMFQAGSFEDPDNPKSKIQNPKSNDGDVRWMACRATVFEDDRGQPLRAIGVNVDITDRKQAEAARSQLNQTLEALIQACPLAITVLDGEDGTVKMWNPAAERIFGWTESEVLGKFVPNVPPEQQAEFTANLTEIRMGNAIAGVEARRLRKDGSSIDIGLWATPLRDSNGNINCMSIVADISDRKQAEAERAQLLDRERAARSEAEALNRLKDEFLATLSHELRTPLNAILGWAQVLRSRRYTEATLACALEAIERQARVQTQLVEDLLDVSRVIQGKLALKLGWFDMVKTIEVAVNSVSLTASSKSIALNSKLDRSVGVMWGDASRLQQIVLNLLANAIKFTPEGGEVEIELSAVAVDGESASADRAIVRVRDTGKGISPDFLPYVFDRFRQADGSITKAHSGLGLGLAIVRHLVELHGGTVRAESPGEGKGATFTVTLPLKQPKNQKLQPKEVKNLPAARSGDLDGLTVLVVDDEPDNLEFLKVLLEDSGASAILAATAARAIEILAQTQPDILVSDIGMPVEDGYSLIRKIRASQSDRTKRLPAVALTAYASVADRDRALASGYDEHLAKPIEPALFAAVLAKMSESRNSC